MIYRINPETTFITLDISSYWKHPVLETDLLNSPGCKPSNCHEVQPGTDSHWNQLSIMYFYQLYYLTLSLFVMTSISYHLCITPIIAIKDCIVITYNLICNFSTDCNITVITIIGTSFSVAFYILNALYTVLLSHPILLLLILRPGFW